MEVVVWAPEGQTAQGEHIVGVFPSSQRHVPSNNVWSWSYLPLRAIGLMGVNVLPSAKPSKTTDCTLCFVGRDLEFSHFCIGDEPFNLSLPSPSFLKALTENRRDDMEHSRCYFLY